LIRIIYYFNGPNEARSQKSVEEDAVQEYGRMQYRSRGGCSTGVEEDAVQQYRRMQDLSPNRPYIRRSRTEREASTSPPSSHQSIIIIILFIFVFLDF